ncbi:MAG: TolC family protein [Bdellovibrionales bacterium]|nr:TolC family protein [Bdellovibrionales bacterium]
MKVAIAIGMIFFCIGSFSKEKLTLTEDNISEMVKRGNHLVRSEEKNVEALKEKTDSFRRSFIPKLSLQIGQETFKYVTSEFNSGAYYKAGMDLNLFNGGRDQLQDEKSQVNFKIARAQEEVSLYGQIEEARKAFWRALYLQHLIAKLEEGMNWVSSSKAAALKRIKSGVATDSDRFEFEIKSVEINQDVERAKLALAQYIESLKILIGVDEKTEISIRQPLSHDHKWRTLLEHSEDEHGYLFEADKLQIERSELTSRLAENRWLPSVDGYAFFKQENLRQDYEHPDAVDRQQTVYGVSATWTLTDFIEGDVLKQSARAEAESKRYEWLFNKRKIENELHMELKELELLDKLVHDAEENIVRSKKFFELISREYKRGVKSSGDMLLATEKLMNSHIRKMEIIRDFQLAKTHVMRKLKK